MKAIDDTTIRVFLMAIAQLDRPIPEEIQQVIDQAKDAIAHQSPEAAATTLDTLANQSSLRSLYTTSWQQLTEQYQAQERSKSAVWAAALPGNNLKQIALQMLNDPAALRLDRTQARSTHRAEEIAVLKSLESHPHTLEDLVYGANLPMEKVTVLMRSLWDQGYIAQTTAGFVYLLFPTPRKRPYPGGTIDPESTYFTLTAKGYFYLHPVLSFDRSGALA
jgi:hypothetical protein